MLCRRHFQRSVQLPNKSCACDLEPPLIVDNNQSLPTKASMNNGTAVKPICICDPSAAGHQYVATAEEGCKNEECWIYALMTTSAFSAAFLFVSLTLHVLFRNSGKKVDSRKIIFFLLQIGCLRKCVGQSHVHLLPPFADLTNCRSSYHLLRYLDESVAVVANGQ